MEAVHCSVPWLVPHVLLPTGVSWDCDSTRGSDSLLGVLVLDCCVWGFHLGKKKKFCLLLFAFTSMVLLGYQLRVSAWGQTWSLLSPSQVPPWWVLQFVAAGACCLQALVGSPSPALPRGAPQAHTVSSSPILAGSLTSRCSCFEPLFWPDPFSGPDSLCCFTPVATHAHLLVGVAWQLAAW